MARLRPKRSCLRSPGKYDALVLRFHCFPVLFIRLMLGLGFNAGVNYVFRIVISFDSASVGTETR
uniref:Uncharacterized protein n=1 Tax=Arundo donax TaxID=35708 RepID=A0A0A9D736_ARUDO